VLFTGHVSAADLGELYSNAYLFVLPSRIEGCSMALLEAMAHGTPVLVSDIPGNLCVVGCDGHTFRMGNRDDLATQLQKLLDDVSATTQMRNQLERRSSTATSWDEIATRYEGAYEQALKG
jgi:glycosyltransferase involved in cell wall biosynthesis